MVFFRHAQLLAPQWNNEILLPSVKFSQAQYQSHPASSMEAVTEFSFSLTGDTWVNNFHCVKLCHQLKFNPWWNCTSCLKVKTLHSHNSSVSSPHPKMDIYLAIQACVGIHDNKPLISSISTIFIETKVGLCWERGERRNTLGSYFAPSPLAKGLDNLLHEHCLGHRNAFNYSSHNWSYCYNKRAKAWSGSLEKMRALLKFNL